jgi:hypothetical protein
MESSSDTRIVSAERMNEGLIIEFEDGKCAFFPTALLREILPQAIPVEEPEEDSAE